MHPTTEVLLFWGGVKIHREEAILRLGRIFMHHHHHNNHPTPPHGILTTTTTTTAAAAAATTTTIEVQGEGMATPSITLSASKSKNPIIIIIIIITMKSRAWEGEGVHGVQMMDHPLELIVSPTGSSSSTSNLTQDSTTILIPFTMGMMGGRLDPLITILRRKCLKVGGGIAAAHGMGVTVTTIRGRITLRMTEGWVGHMIP